MEKHEHSYECGCCENPHVEPMLMNECECGELMCNECSYVHEIYYDIICADCFGNLTTKERSQFNRMDGENG